MSTGRLFAARIWTMIAQMVVLIGAGTGWTAVPGSLSVAILNVEDERDGSARWLEGLLTDRDAEVRQRAALALGRIGEESMAGYLIQHLRREPDPAVRESLCAALGLIGRPQAIKVLVQTLASDPSVAVRCRAVEALGFVGELVWRTVVAIFRHKDERAVEPLAVLARKGTGTVRRAATWGLARLASATGVPTLRELAACDDPFVCAWAIRGLGAVRRATAREVLPLLSHPVRIVRVHAIAAAGSSKVAEAVGPLLRIARVDPDTNLRIEAIHALGLIGDAAAVALLEEFRGLQGNLGRACDLALARLKVPESRFLGGAVDRSSWTILDWLGWIEALAAHGGIGARGHLSRLATVERVPGDTSGVAVAAAVAALAESAQAPEAPVLVFHLKSPDPFVRAAVVEPLLKLRGGAALMTVMDSYTAAPNDPIDESRLATVRAVTTLKVPGREALLRAALKDRSRNVRLEAIKGLLDMGEKRSRFDPGPVGTGRPRSHYRRAAELVERTPVATVATTAGTFTIALLAREAPLTVMNFMDLARSGRFDGLLIPRVVPEFVVQMGDPRGDLSGSPGYAIRCEVNRLPYERGTVGMALSGKDTGGCQFFVTGARHPHLDGIYTAFGRVVRGMEVVDRIVKGDRIISVTVE
ncbi:MAG: HEAT repeat domain-containing protein [Candidatus Riflebacteria bacterium]|nr:HEAT repeat domain-containing protein [Candidatus Riflebacteria bacterium]